MSELSVAEKATVAMSNLLKRKELYGIIITGNTTTGTYTQVLENPISLNNDASHKVYLQSFSAWSNIPNIKKDVNDNFTYINTAGTSKSITIPPGGYQLLDIYTYIQNAMLSNSDQDSSTSPTSYYINFTTVLPTQQVQITIRSNFQVDLRPANSVAKLIGFNNILLTGNTSFYSTNLVNILTAQSININCDIASGFLFNGKSSNILYSFNNSIPRGTMINLQPNPIVPCTCNKKLINSVTVSFNDENGTRINFNNEQFIIRLIIEQF